MESNENGTKVRRGMYSQWCEVDTTTGLVKLDEGLFFHFKQTSEGLVCSIRAKRWWGDWGLYQKVFMAEEVSPHKLLKASCHTEDGFRTSRAKERYTAYRLKKNDKVRKYMGSYQDRSINEVDSV